MCHKSKTMAKSNEFGCTLMGEVTISAAKAGWEPKNMDDFSKDENLMKLVLGVMHGTHEIKGTKHDIDCDAEPFIPTGLKLEEHQKGGTIKFDVSNVVLYLARQQQIANIDCWALRGELRGKKVLNANVLDFLLKHPEFIPEHWKSKKILFWGTIYRGCYKETRNELYVRYLSWSGGNANRWDHANTNITSNDFNLCYPAAMFAI